MNGYMRYFEGNLVEELIDNNDGTGRLIKYKTDGSVNSEDSVTGLDIYPKYLPLDSTGALATLLVVLNIVPIQDAANAIHEEPDHLIAEAQAWALG